MQQGQHIFLRAVTAKSLDVLIPHDGEGVQDVGRVVGVQAVEVEEQRIQRRQTGAAFFAVSYKGRQHMTFR